MQLADKRQKEAARQGRLPAQVLLGAADGIVRLPMRWNGQPSLSWLQPKTPNPGPKGMPVKRDAGTRGMENAMGIRHWNRKTDAAATHRRPVISLIILAFDDRLPVLPAPISAARGQWQ